MTTLAPGAQIEANTVDWTRLAFDWSKHFTTGSQLLDVGTFEVVDVSSPPTAQEVVPTLTVTEPLMSVSNLAVTFSVKGGTLNHIYRVSHSVSSTESPTQKRKRSIFVWVKYL